MAATSTVKANRELQMVSFADSVRWGKCGRGEGGYRESEGNFNGSKHSLLQRR